MIPDPSAVHQALENARQFVQRGDRQSARRWAERAISLDPDQEEAWLILAAVASPRASVAYLERALRINPASERARQGLVWARQRLGQEQANQQTLPDTQPQRRVGKRPGAASRTRVLPRRPPVTVAQSAPKADRLPSKALTKYRWSYAALALALLCMAAVAAFWPGNASPALALLRGPQPTQISGALAEVDKPTYTPTFTATFTPTATFTSTPTFTPTFTPTDTPLPTPTPVPTDTPWPTSIPFQPVAEEPLLYDYGYGVHWIDVDLSEQMVYAYEGDTIVASFLVSTGVAAYPTVVGQFHIYMKFEYTDMAGPGYYLPDVPYTMYFYKGYGLHGTYWHNNFGTPMSHGCVNMYTPDAQWLFYWAPMGTLVNVHY
jgi:lipoprotein-anchoring transpeptidase ErfK/SrfK